MNKKSIVLAAAIMSLATVLFAVDDDLVTRYLTAANEQYTAGNFQKAFTYVNVVLNSYKAETVPGNVEVIAETIYWSYLDTMRESRDWKSFNTVKEKLIEFPYLSTERMTRLVRILNTYEAQDGQWGEDPIRPETTTMADVVTGNAASRSNGALQSVYTTMELQLALETIKKDAAEQTQRVNDAFQQQLLTTQKEAYETALKETKEATGANNRVLIFALLIVAGVSFIVFIVVVINLVVNLKNSKTQNDRFVETLKVVSQIAASPARPVGLEALPPLYGAGDNVRMIGSTAAETGLPPAPETEEEKAELNALAQKCRDIGIMIDQRTGRKNNSKNVAETVFKIAQEMGVSQYEAMLLFSVAMVYDIGFLEIDASLLQAQTLTDEQKHEIRNHVKQGLAQLSFVPDRYMSIFADGVLMHHENMDGTGYPEGLSGMRIPYIARLLRVSESFVALISRRSYRDIYDKESAVDELKQKPGLYDSAIVEVLEKLI